MFFLAPHSVFIDNVWVAQINKQIRYVLKYKNTDIDKKQCSLAALIEQTITNKY